MEIREIKEAVALLEQTTGALEDAYVLSGGEVTAETEAAEAEKAALTALLTSDGVDTLGRWLKAKEDERKALKAEKDAIARKVQSVDNTIAYIKELTYSVLQAAGIDKAKGNCYSFTPYVASRVELDRELLKANYADRVEAAIRAAGIPDYIGVTLTASSSKADALAEGDEYLFNTVQAGTVRFVKPRASKDGEDEV